MRCNKVENSNVTALYFTCTLFYTPEQRITYTPWGQRNLTTDNTATGKFLFDRGFSGHEHLDQFKLINMNGRLYDPLLGRMLSPDNYIQSTNNSQSFNRYTYCLNNPLLYTDPSGEFWGIFIGAGIGGLSYVIQTAVKGESFKTYNFFTAIGQGAVGGLVGGTGSSVQVSGIVPGALYGSFTGAFSSGLFSGVAAATQGGGFKSFKRGFKEGLLIGAISGTISGGWSGYQSAKANGASLAFGNYLEDLIDFLEGYTVQNKKTTSYCLLGSYEANEYKFGYHRDQEWIETSFGENYYSEGATLDQLELWGHSVIKLNNAKAFELAKKTKMGGYISMDPNSQHINEPPHIVAIAGMEKWLSVFFGINFYKLQLWNLNLTA